MLKKVAYVCAGILAVLLGLRALSVFGFILTHNPGELASNVIHLAIDVVQSGFLIYVGLDLSRRVGSLENKEGKK